MKDRIFIRDYLDTYFDEVEPWDFYRAIFPAGELEEKGQQMQGKYNAIAVELLPAAEEQPNKAPARRCFLHDGLESLSELLESDNFIILSPISYAGKSRSSQNARYIYAMAIDLDGITDIGKLQNLFHQIEIGYLPRPTYIVWSGTGLHLYYQFARPLPCYKNVVAQLAALKTELTKKIWNGLVSELAEKPQIESLFQGFRLVGGITKGGNRTKAYEIGRLVEIEYLNEFVPDKSKVKEYAYKSNLTLQEAAAKYPEWYDKRIVNKQPRGTWQANRAVYDWWLNELKAKIVVGHRYYGVMVLAIYAKKCGIDYDELSEDAYSLVDMLDELTIEEQNRFTREDVLAALEMFNDNYITFPIDSISALTAIHIEKNKRNYRKQPLHLKIARNTKAILKEAGELKSDGRPKGSKNKEQIRQQIITQWRKDNPYKSVKESLDALNELAAAIDPKLTISRATAYRYWKNGEADQ
jgi:hypothetical protein